MITERARIVALDAEAVWVEARRESACGRCAARAGCGHGLLEQAASGRVVHLRLARPAGTDDWTEGQTLLVGIDEHAVLAGSVRVYALPLAGFLLGAVAGGAFGGDGPAALGACVGFAAAFALVRALDGRRPLPPPRILRRVEAVARPAAGDDDEPRPLTVV